MIFGGEGNASGVRNSVNVWSGNRAADLPTGRCSMPIAAETALSTISFRPRVLGLPDAAQRGLGRMEEITAVSMQESVYLPMRPEHLERLMEENP